jgi:hypothetical protein
MATSSPAGPAPATVPPPFPNPASTSRRVPAVEPGPQRPETGANSTTVTAPAAFSAELAELFSEAEREAAREAEEARLRSEQRRLALLRDTARFD